MHAASHVIAAMQQRRDPARDGSRAGPRASMLLLAMCLVQAWCTSAGRAEADTVPSSNTSARNGATVVYEAEYFRRFDVITVVDMLRRIPGVTAILNDAADADDVRGFGSAGDQVLINGRRMAGKANDLIPALERIQATHVRRIELIRGTSPDIDVRSEGVLVNIVLERGVDAVPAFSWSIGGAYLLDTELKPVGSLSYGGEIGALTFLVGADLAQRQLSRQLRDHDLFRPDGTRFQRFDEIRDERTSEASLTSNLIYTFAGGRELRLNGLLLRAEEITDEPRDRFAIDGANEQFSSTLRRREDDVQRKWEIGADYVHPVGDRNRFSVLAVYTDTNADIEQLRRVLGTSTEQLLSLELTDEHWTEAIVRTSYQWNMNTHHSLEIGAERAINRLNTDFRLFRDVDGEVVELEIFNSDSLVEEVRSELFTTHTWQITRDLSLESALNAEFSRIEQSGADVSTARSFSFLKPRLDLRYDLTAQDQFRVRFERIVSQLDFANFIASFDFEGEQLRSGNPALVPQHEWETQLAYERRLRDDAGVLEVRVFRRDVHDYIDRILVDGSRAAFGNLGRGREYGGEIKGSLRLARLGLPDAVLSASYLRQRSRVDDPLTGEARLFSTVPEYDWRIEYRHDLATYPLSYGLELRRIGPRSTFEVPWFRYFDSKPQLSGFVQARVWGGMTLVVEGSMLIRDAAERDQAFFLVHRGDGTPTRTEYMHRRSTPQVTVMLRGRF